MTPIASRTARAAVLLAAAGLLLAGCATPEPSKPAAPEPPKPAPVVVAPEPPKPAPPPEPVIPPAQARAQAQKLSIDAITQLQNGDEAGATKTLEQALTLDPANDLAKKLMDQIKADPQRELGSTFFRYTVQRDDSLSKLAQQYLGDRYKFHILAKYNDIPNPSKLAAGQVIKIPGKAPPPTAKPASPPPPEPTDEAAKAAQETATPRSASAALMQQGADLSKAGNLEGAYDAYREASLRDPGNKDAATQRDATRTQLARRYEREAAQAFQRQNLDEAINKWDRVLALEPGNQKAKLERERAIDLRRRMAEKFGSPSTAAPK